MRIDELQENGNLGLTIFDIDETLFRTTAQIKVVKDGQVIRSLTNQEFNTYELQPGEDFDFGEFKDAEKFNRESIPIEPMIAKLKAILKNSGNSKVIMLTARSDFDNKDLFLDTFRKYGIDINRIHVHRAGNLGGAPAENKEVFIRKYLDTGDYARVRLYDDSMTNIRMFNALSKEYPDIQFFPYFVTHEGGIKTVREAVGRIVKGVNTTVDVGPNEIKTQAAKFGNTVDKDGRPPTLSSRVRGKSTNVLFNLGLAESKKSIFQALTETETHTVQQGDTLYGISRQYGVSIEDLQTWNELSGNTIRLGQELYVAEPEPTDLGSISPQMRPPSFFNSYERLLIRVAKASGIVGRELAQLLAQAAHETQNYQRWIEQGSRQYFNRYEGSEVLGNTEPGDGFRFRGRGYLQLTGRYNYNRAGEALGLNLIEMPDLAERPYISAQIAIWYWNTRVRTNASDPSDTRQATRFIQGRRGGLESRQRYFDRYMNMIRLIDQETGDFREIESVEEAWSEKYKRSINCNNPKGFSQRAHCAGRKK